MRKLRVFKERKNDPAAEKDQPELRGLGDSGLFRDACWTMQLYVTPPPAMAHVRELCAAYNVTSEPFNQDEGLLRIVSRWQEGGEHKKQALALFFVAMDIHRSHPRSRLLLLRHDGIRHEIARRIESAPKKDETFDRVHEWARGESHFVVDSMATKFLSEVEVGIEARDTDLVVTPEIVTAVAKAIAPMSGKNRRRAG